MFIDYVESLLGPAKYNTAETEANWDCPFCTDTRKRFRINVNKLLCYCFNCGWKGNAITFVREYNKVSWHEAFDIVNFYEDFRPLPQDVYEEVFDVLFMSGAEDELPKKNIPLPEDFIRLDSTKSPLAKRFYAYAKSRKLTDRQISLHGCGFCPEGEMTLPNGKKLSLANRLIVQTFDDDNTPVYWVARSVLEGVKPKVYNPVGGVRTINKSDVIFNLNNAKKTGVAVLCEGVFSATTVGDSGVALFGKTMSVKQLILLIRANLEAVYVMLDPDALADALKICDMLSKHIKNVYFCRLTTGDPNDIGRAGCLQAIRDAERYTSLTALKYKLLQ